MSTVIVLVMHIVLPMLTMRDLLIVKNRLKSTISEYLTDINSMKAHPSDTQVFNVATYFFVSTRLSLLYPKLRESQIIQKFKTPWPHQSYRRTKSLSTGYRKRFATLAQSLSMVIIFFLKTLLSLPPSFQDMFVNLFTVLIFGNLLSLSVDLYRISPVLSVLPFLLLSLLFSAIAVLLVRYYLLYKATNAKIAPVSSVLNGRSIDKQVNQTPEDVINNQSDVVTRRQSVIRGLSVALELHALSTAPDRADINRTHDNDPIIAVNRYDGDGDLRSVVKEEKLKAATTVPISANSDLFYTPLPSTEHTGSKSMHLEHLYQVSDDEDGNSGDYSCIALEKVCTNCVVQSSLNADQTSHDTSGYSPATFADVGNEIFLGPISALKHDAMPLEQLYQVSDDENEGDDDDDDVSTNNYSDDDLHNTSKSDAGANHAMLSSRSVENTTSMLSTESDSLDAVLTANHSIAVVANKAAIVLIEIQPRNQSDFGELYQISDESDDDNGTS